ncbi:MAG: peptidase S41 [Candidatus Dojkabacteria bacterium]|nr:MAG: peptidase S41 [Candidatus Dojkabacteria bacterium]
MKNVRDTAREVFPFWVVSALFAGIAFGITLTKIPNFLNSAQERVNQSTYQAGGLEDLNLDTKLFNEVYKYLNTTYIGEIPESKEIEYGLIKGLINSLNDEYTSFLTPEEAKLYQDSLVENFEGIGVTLSYNGEYTYVETVLEGLPAYQNGILPGDVILRVDDEDVTGKLPQLVASKIRGERGTEVKLTIFRSLEGGLGETKEFRIIRDKIVVENIMWKEKEDGLVVIDISQFNASSLDEFKKNWDEVVAEVSNLDNLDGIVVDLRNNPGGLVAGVSYILEEFLNEGNVIYGERSKSQRTAYYKDSREGKFENVELVVLVNEGSASASEIFAGAIQENNRGEVVGMPTVGKGVEQIIIDFEDGSMLILVFQEWLTPSGRVLNKENPIIPDIEVDYTIEDFENGVDPQMEKALELLRS